MCPASTLRCAALQVPAVCLVMLAWVSRPPLAGLLTCRPAVMRGAIELLQNWALPLDLSVDLHFLFFKMGKGLSSLQSGHLVSVS